MALLLSDVAKDLDMSGQEAETFLLANEIALKTIVQDITPRTKGAKKKTRNLLIVSDPRQFHLWRARQWFEADHTGKERIGGHFLEHTPFAVTSEELGLPRLEISRTPVHERLQTEYPNAVEGYLKSLPMEGNAHGTQSQ